MQYSYSFKMFTGRVKLIRTISDPDHELPDKWSFTVFWLTQLLFPIVWVSLSVGSVATIKVATMFTPCVHWRSAMFCYVRHLQIQPPSPLTLITNLYYSIDHYRYWKNTRWMCVIISCIHLYIQRLALKLYAIFYSKGRIFSAAANSFFFVRIKLAPYSADG
jgi:hypothetical protein